MIILGCLEKSPTVHWLLWKVYYYSRETRRPRSWRQRAIKKRFKACIKIGWQQFEYTVKKRWEKKGVDLVTKRKKEQEKKEQVCHKISEQGLWNFEVKIIAGVYGSSDTNQRKFLEAHLRFEQHILKQSRTDKSLYCVSRNRRICWAVGKSAQAKFYLSTSNFRGNTGIPWAFYWLWNT